MAILCKHNKRRVNGTYRNQISDFDSLSIGYCAGDQIVLMHLHDHYVELSADDVEFILRELPRQQARLTDYLKRLAATKG